jgi:hypothetical protein
MYVHLFIYLFMEKILNYSINNRQDIPNTPHGDENGNFNPHSIYIYIYIYVLSIFTHIYIYQFFYITALIIGKISLTLRTVMRTGTLTPIVYIYIYIYMYYPYLHIYIFIYFFILQH